MIVTKVAKRYASALFQEAKSRKQLDQVADDIHRIRDTISDSSELQLFLKSQIISRDHKGEVLATLFDKESSEITRQFMKLLLDKRRENQLLIITEAFDLLYKKETGQIDIEVFVFKLPDSEQSEKLKKALEHKTGNKVNLFYAEDKSLIGGIAVRIEDTVIDGTVKHKLQQLETSFQKAGI